MCAYTVTFSDGRRLPVEAANRDQARIVAYRIDRSAVIVDIIPA